MTSVLLHFSGSGGKFIGTPWRCALRPSEHLLFRHGSVVDGGGDAAVHVTSVAPVSAGVCDTVGEGGGRGGRGYTHPGALAWRGSRMAHVGRDVERSVVGDSQHDDPPLPVTQYTSHSGDCRSRILSCYHQSTQLKPCLLSWLAL